MTDKHIPASKLLALHAYKIDGPDVILLSDLRAIIDEAPEVGRQDPFGYVLSINGEIVFRKTITESESLVYSSMPVYCGDHKPVPSSVIDALLTRAKEYLK